MRRPGAADHDPPGMDTPATPQGEQGYPENSPPPANNRRNSSVESEDFASRFAQFCAKNLHLYVEVFGSRLALEMRLSRRQMRSANRAPARHLNFRYNPLGTRRDGRVAEGGGLLNRCRVKSSTGGSNPPLSAIDLNNTMKIHNLMK